MKFKIKTFIFIIAINLFFLHCATESKKTEYEVVKRVDSFSGKNVKDSDITIHSHKEKGIISISGNREKFFFLLPYSEDWIVKYTDNSIIQLNSNEKNLIVSVTTENSNTRENPEKFLWELKARVQSRIGIPLQNARILSDTNHKILSYFLEVENQGIKIKSDNFWSFRQRFDNMILKLHFSTLNVPEDDIRKMEQTLPIFMDTGFRILTHEDFTD